MTWIRAVCDKPAAIIVSAVACHTYRPIKQKRGYGRRRERMGTSGTRKVLEGRRPALRGKIERTNCYLKMSLAVTETVAIKGQLFKLNRENY